MIPGILLYLEDLKQFSGILTDSDLGAVIRALMAYIETGEEVSNLSPVCELAYRIIKSKVEREIKKYETQTENGKKGGRPKTQENPTKPNETQQNPMKPNGTQDNQKEKETEKETENEKENEKRESTRARTGGGFEPPTLDQVRAYVNAKRLRMDPEAFYVYYKARGWMMGAAQMVDWESACEGWAKKEKPDSGGKPNLRVLGSSFSGQRDLTEDEMKGTTDDDILAAIMAARQQKAIGG